MTRPSQSTGGEPVGERHVVLGRDDDHEVRREPVRTVGAVHLPVREVRRLHDDRHADFVDVERDLVGVALRCSVTFDRIEARARSTVGEIVDVDALPVVGTRRRSTAGRAARRSCTTRPPSTPTRRARDRACRRPAARCRSTRTSCPRASRRRPVRTSSPCTRSDARHLVDLPTLRVGAVEVRDRRDEPQLGVGCRPSPAPPASTPCSNGRRASAGVRRRGRSLRATPYTRPRTGFDGCARELADGQEVERRRAPTTRSTGLPSNRCGRWCSTAAARARASCRRC